MLSPPDDDDQGWLLPSVLPRFWRLLGAEKAHETSVRDVDLTLARALAQTYLAAEVRVGWAIGDRVQGHAVAGPRDSTGQPWSAPFPADRAALQAEASPGAAVAWVQSSDGAALTLAVGPLLDSGWSSVADRTEALRVELQGSIAQLVALRQTVGTVRERAAVGEENQHLRRIADAELELQYLLFHDRRGLRPWLRRAADFTGKQLAPLTQGSPRVRVEALRLAERLSRRLMHRLLELGGAELSAPGERARAACDRERAVLTELVEGLAAACLPPSADRPPSELAHRHAAALWVIGGLLRPTAPVEPPAPSGEGPRTDELRLFLAAWAHQQALERRPVPEASWPALHGALRAHLGAILAAPPPGGLSPAGRARDPNALHSVRAWMRLWLLHELVHSEADRVRLHQRELTGLAVELLRQKVFYGADPIVVADRSRRFTATLVRLHLQHVLGLRGAEVAGTLSLLSQGRPGRGVEDGHQHVDHVLDHYLVGQLLWSAQLRLPGPAGLGTLGAALIHGDGRFALQSDRDRLASALGLAALSHDAGLAYFPQLSPPLAPQLDPQRCAGAGAHGEPMEDHDQAAIFNAPGAQDPTLTEALDARDAALHAAGARLVDAALDALVAAGVLSVPSEAPASTGPTAPVPGPPSLSAGSPPLSAGPPPLPAGPPPIPAGPDTPLGRWLANQRATGRVDHALSGAFVLYRGAIEGGVAPEVWVPAVRAVLLHGPADQPVDAKIDPVAALLILLDEALSWEPAHRAEDGSASRTAALALPGLQRAVDPTTGKLALRLPDHHGGPIELQIDVWLGHLEQPDALAFPDWITAAQAIGRVRSEAGALQPRLRLTGPVPPKLRQVGSSTRAQLDELRQNPKIDAALEELIAAHLLPGSTEPDADLDEGVLLGPVNPEAVRRDARPQLRALLQEAHGKLPRAEG